MTRKKNSCEIELIIPIINRPKVKYSDANLKKQKISGFLSVSAESRQLC